jgi:hypothetical protein
MCCTLLPRAFALHTRRLCFCITPQVTALAIGRLYAKLGADDALGHLLLPLLADLLSSADSDGGGSSGGGQAGAPAAAHAAASGPRAPAAVAAAAMHAHAAPATAAAQVAGAVVCALEGMASVCVQHGGDPWLYEQALQLLLTLYREPSPVSGCWFLLCAAAAAAVRCCRFALLVLCAARLRALIGRRRGCDGHCVLPLSARLSPHTRRS